jgi:hypothetical protein
MILDHAVEEGVITAEERAIVRAADRIRDEVIQVDSFDPESYLKLRG